MQPSLWIMRHAASGPTTDAKNDDKRPLDPEGVQAAKAAGVALKALGTPIQGCLSSPLTRARQTAELVSDSLGLKVHLEPKLGGGPLTPADIKLLTKPYGNCLLVGHAPACNLWVRDMTGCQCQLAKGGLAQIHEGEVWTLLNPSTCLTMAGKGDSFDDPQDVDVRSTDDLVPLIPEREPEPAFLHRATRADWELVIRGRA
jgi:phosphohistidine phosphatase SixA